MGIYSLSQGLENIENSLRSTYNNINNNINIVRDNQLRMFSELIEDLESGKKVVAIRYSKNGIRIPNVNDEYILPIVRTTLENPKSGPNAGSIQIPKIFISTVARFPEEYFILDGYPDKKTGLKDLGEIYNCIIKPNEFLSMYWLENFERF